MASKPTYQELENRIAELKKQNEAFQISSQEEGIVLYYDTVFNNMGDPVFVKDDKSRLLIVNDAFCELFHLERDQIIGKTLAEDVSPEERESFLKIDKLVLESGAENINEESLTLRGGQTKTISTRKTRHIDSEGKKFLIGIIRDITERKNEEEHLKALNQQLAANEQQLRAANQQLTANEQQLRAANQQLTANEQQLRASNQQLRANEQQLRAANQQLQTSEKELIKHKEKIEESEQKYKALYENAPLSYQSLNEDGRFKDVNPSWLSTLGYKREEVIGKFYKDFLHPDWQDHFSENFPKFKKRGYVSDVEFRIRHKKGHYIDISFEGCIGYHPDGSFKQTYCVFQDITTKKKAEQDLIQNQYYLSKAQQMGNIGTWELDIIANNLVWTDEAYNIFGIPIGTKMSYELFLAIVHPDDRNLVNDSWTDAMNKEPYDIEHRLLVNGNIKWVRQKAELTFDTKGNAVNAIGFAQDITERKKAEEQLKASNQQLQANEQQLRAANQQLQTSEKELIKNKEKAERYLNVAAEIILSLDKKGNITLLNESGHKLLGYKTGQLIGENWFITCLPEKKVEEIKNVFKQTISGQLKNVANYESNIQTKAGEIRTILWHNSILQNEDGEIIGTLSSGEDITDIKNTEIELIKAKEKAEESDHLKSAFLANMSHEIRTPMNGILGFTNLLRNPDLTGKQQDKFIKIIQKSGDRMLQTVNNIVDISKIDAKLIEISKSELNIKQEIESLYEFFRTEALSKGLEFVLRCKLPDTQIYTDKAMFDSIISNLIKNAIKYTDKGSIDITCNKRGSKLDISVRDTGIGIAKEKLQVIFDRFIQADIKDVHARQGSGLGLSITKAYVEMLGGEISVESTSDKGSIFHLTLPWDESSEKVLENNKDQRTISPDLKALNILISEDDDTSFDYLKIILNSASENISWVKNGKDAVAYLKAHSKIDLVLMDLKMPVMNGYDATRQIRKFNKEVAIIAQTAYALEEDKNKALEAGCNDYISKPINEVELLNVIEKHCIK